MGTRSSSAKKMGMEGCTEEVLEQFNYCAHPGFDRGYCIVTLPVFCFLAKWGQRSNRESCIVLENKQTCSLIPKTPQRSLVAVREYRTASKRRCGRGYDRYVLTLLSDVVAPAWSSSEWLQLCMWAQRQYELWVNVRILYGERLHGGPRKTTELSKITLQ